MRNTYRKENGEIIIGQALPIFIHNLNFHLTELLVYKDGKIDCWGLVDFDTFVSKVKSGWVKTSLPKKADLYAFPLGNFRIKEFFPMQTEEELIKEVKDIVESLNDRPTTSELCTEAFRNWQLNQLNENREKLRTTYEAIPLHKRRFVLGDMDVDDIPIRVVIYGEAEFDKTHKGQIQKQYIKDYYLKM